jgi:hypothetical protein
MASGLARKLLGAGCLSCLVLAACGRQGQGQDEMSWARAALERNDRIEIVATDPQARTFTVRMKDTGNLSVVRADQLVGGPAAAAATSTGAAPSAAVPAGGEAAPAAAAPASAAATAPAASAGEAATPAREAATPALPPEPPVFASRALHPGSPAHPVPGQVLEAGPGYSIEAGSTPASAAAAPAAPLAGSGTVELRHEPIVCQGARLLHIDNQNLQFEGDAVSAQDGCEIHITNSRIRATGVGVLARAADVHIDNSLIEGDAASIDASDGAQIYAASSRFRGLSRRLDTAAVHDLGGNVWN